MNLKITYHYSYFIYPFIISEGKYKDFISKFLSDKAKWDINIRSNPEDLNTHAYFLPYVKKFLFPTLYWSEELKEQYNNMSYKERLEIASKLTCVNFDYRLDMVKSKGYRLNETGINFSIIKIELICFAPGICFLLFKTMLDKVGGIHSDDLLNFNYKFRTINPRYLKRKKTEGMYIMNEEFAEVEDLSGFIEHLLYGYENVEMENIYFDRLFTYSYMCLHESEWNENIDLSEIIEEFYKFQYVLPEDYGSTFAPDYRGIKDNTYTRWKYSIYGFSRESGVVFSSERESFNSTKLPNYYETMYFYIFLLAFYQRISLILFSQELMTSEKGKIENLKQRFTRFTHFSWFGQITNSEQGMDIWKRWQRAFDLPQLFDEVQKEYSEFYDYTVARGQEKINFLLIIIYVVSLVFSAMALLADFHLIDTNGVLTKLFLKASIALTITGFPIYKLVKTIFQRKKNSSKKYLY
ncbi:MAG: hypothetical protein Q8930_11575 [Bacillota bacterium]|nr:hypothetical protein [Bacillota bacterium]